MRCPICDKDSDTVTLIDPCHECQEAIFECIAGYEDLSNDDPILDPEADLVG